MKKLLLLLLTLLGCVSATSAPIPTPIVSPSQQVEAPKVVVENDMGPKTYVNAHWEITLPSSLEAFNSPPDTIVLIDRSHHLVVSFARTIVELNTNTAAYAQQVFQHLSAENTMILMDRHDHISIQGKGNQKDREFDVVYFEAKKNDDYLVVAYCWVSGQAGYVVGVIGNEYNYDMAVQTLKDLQKTIKIAD